MLVYNKSFFTDFQEDTTHFTDVSVQWIFQNKFTFGGCYNRTIEGS